MTTTEPMPFTWVTARRPRADYPDIDDQAEVAAMQRKAQDELEFALGTKGQAVDPSTPVSMRVVRLPEEAKTHWRVQMTGASIPIADAIEAAGDQFPEYVSRLTYIREAMA